VVAAHFPASMESVRRLPGEFRITDASSEERMGDGVGKDRGYACVSVEAPVQVSLST
jgi:hypothetical protein